MSVEKGDVLGAYEILAPLGVGGMGEVYRARHLRLDREAAIKVLPARLSQDAHALARFEREARAVAALSHPNILAIHDFGEQDGTHYAAMELLEGATLRQRLASHPLSWREAVEIGVAIASGLAAAHDKGIVHRDIKPENLFLTSSGGVKVLDFGLAIVAPKEKVDEDSPTAGVLTNPGMVMGTVTYMSPEQVRGADVDARSDIFSLGCVLYEMIAGVRPFSQPTTAETMAAILKDEPTPLSRAHLGLPAEVAQVVERCLEKDPLRRFQSARDLAFSLKAPAAAPASSSPPAETARPALDSLAVLPFTNSGSDAETEYVADGITENLINFLSKLRGMRVVPRTTAFRYRGREWEPDVVGRELKVRAILTGKIVLRGDTLSVQAELVDVGDGAQLWGERYRRPAKDLLAVEEEIARELAERLKGHLSGADRDRAERRQTVDAEAYRLYLQGRYHWNKRTPQALDQARGIFEQAIERDPDYAKAHAGLADCYSQLSFFGWLPPREGYPLARRAALRALELDPELAEAHASLGHVLACHYWDWGAAEAEFRRAFQLDPGYATGHYWYAFGLLTPLGRHQEAALEVARACELEPLSLAINTYAGGVCYLARWYDRAAAYCRAALELEPRFPQGLWFLGMSYLMQSHHEEALAELQKAEAVSPFSQWVLGGLGHAYAVLGDVDQARGVLARMIDRARTHYMSPYLIAYVHAGLGERELALDRLEQACAERADTLIFAKVDPVFDSIRAEPRFAEVLRRMGLSS